MRPLDGIVVEPELSPSDAARSATRCDGRAGNFLRFHRVDHVSARRGHLSDASFSVQLAGAKCDLLADHLRPPRSCSLALVQRTLDAICVFELAAHHVVHGAARERLGASARRSPVSDLTRGRDRGELAFGTTSTPEFGHPTSQSIQGEAARAIVIEGLVPWLRSDS